MTTSILNIGYEINQIISSSKSGSGKLTEQEKINRFLDNMNSLKTKLAERTAIIQKLDELFCKLTWYDLQSQEEEVLMKSVISTSYTFHSRSMKNFIALKKAFWKDNICRDEISSYKSTLDDFEESICEVEEIFFKLRKDTEFTNLIKSV